MLTILYRVELASGEGCPDGLMIDKGDLTQSSRYGVVAGWLQRSLEIMLAVVSVTFLLGLTILRNLAEAVLRLLLVIINLQSHMHPYTYQSYLYDWAFCRVLAGKARPATVVVTSHCCDVSQ